MIRHNLGYKLVALAAAIMLWAYVGNPNVTARLALPLDVRKLGTDLVITDRPNEVKVALEGPKKYVNLLAAAPDSVTPYISLHGKKEGRHRLPVFVEVPLRYTDLVQTRTDPAEVSVRIEQKAERAFKVDVQFSNAPPVGFRSGPAQISPSKGVVAGTAATVERVHRLIVPVDPGASGATTIDGEFRLMALDENGHEIHGLEISPEKVRLRLEVRKASVSRVVFISPTILGRPPFPHEVRDIDVEPQSVTLVGPAERLINITTVGTEPLRLDHRTKTFSQRVRVLAPSGTSLEDRRDVRITATITRPQAEASEGSGPEAANGQ